MEKISFLLIFIGISVFTFSFWSFLSIKKHLRQFRNSFKYSSSLTDEKYFELKSKQEYIIAISAVIFSILSFIGYTSIENIKTDMTKRVESEIQKIDSLKKKASDNYSWLEIRGKNYEDSVRSAMNVVSVLTKRVKGLINKDVLTQDIFIIDPLRIGDFPNDKSDKYDEGYHEIKFSALRTINGKKLPIFKEIPSIICSSSGFGIVNVKKILHDRFIVQLESYLPSNEKDKGDNVTFTAWISQKPTEKSFNNDFNSDFK